MELSNNFLTDFALILVVTKFLSLVAKKIGLPPVVGALIGGFLIGPSVLGIISDTDTINSFSQIGVILLMFAAGTETDLKQIKDTYKSASMIAFFGVITPLILGTLVASIYNQNFLQNLFIGVIITATSVSITVETLNELGKLHSKSGAAIVNAAIIDDILGIVCLTFIISANSGSSNVGKMILFTLAKVVAFFIISVVVGYIAHKIFVYYNLKGIHKHSSSVFAIALCLFMARLAEMFGLADITGAYIAGIILANANFSPYIEEATQALSFVFFSPIFFASIGLKAELHNIKGPILVMSVLLFAAAFFSKLIGCFVGGKICRYSNMDSIIIGVGMVGRGEVALIMAMQGLNSNLLSTTMFSPIIFIVIATSLITPLFLSILYKKQKKDEDLQALTLLNAK